MRNCERWELIRHDVMTTLFAQFGYRECDVEDGLGLPRGTLNTWSTKRPPTPLELQLLSMLVSALRETQNFSRLVESLKKPHAHTRNANQATLMVNTIEYGPRDISHMELILTRQARTIASLRQQIQEQA